MTALPMQFSVTGRDAGGFGKYFWCVGLPDGREASFCADRVEIKDGVLLAFCHQKEETEILGFALAPGMWTDVYTASAIDSAPMAIENLAKPRPVRKPS